MAKKTTKSNKEKKATGKKAEASLLKNPRVTEKTAHASADSVFVFDVSISATKPEIAKAFEVAYKHVPLKVNTMTRKPKAHFKRTSRGGELGFSKKIKKAYIHLPKGTNIDVM